MSRYIGCWPNPKYLTDKLKGYMIEGDIDELRNILQSNALIETHLRDIILALSRYGTNYIRIGYGETLTEAFKEAAAKGKECRLVHIFFPAECPGFTLSDLYNFIIGIGEDIIFGYTPDNTMRRGLKLVMIFN